ncbi:MAG: peptidoglycan bridge formation glycyltransferase FemA/FemB family protein [Elusimicrobia bacterium]|nr:peptidoglycan bridge formation glycyltransferase FemA/FemB family protein [Elusimicrobiota bacterium]
MVNGLSWKVVSRAEAESRWDGWLAQFEDQHIRQSFAWGLHKSRSWEPVHTGLFDGPTPVALGLCLEKRLPFASTLSWINAGPVFFRPRSAAENLSALSKYLEGLKDYLGRRGRPMLRIYPYCAMDLEAQVELRRSGFIRPLTRIGSGLSYVLDLRADAESLQSGLERHWRNQLRASKKAQPSLVIGTDRVLLEKYIPLHNSLCDRKRLPHQRIELEELQGLVDRLGANIRLLLASVDGEHACGMVLWTLGRRAFLAYSAASELGLRRNLPNFLYWRAALHLKEQGVELWDLMGVDPADNWGVFNFKRGLGGRLIEYLGEWDWSNSPWIRRGFNAALWWRRDRLG